VPEPTPESSIPPGEPVLWSGAPKKGLQFQGADIFTTLFGLFFLFISSTFVVAMFPGGLLLPHFWVGVYLSFGRFFVDAKRRSSTRYWLSSNRIVIAKSWPRTQVQTVTLADDQQTIVTTHGNGTSSVTFGTTVPGWKGGSRRTKVAGDPTFEYLEKPLEVTQALDARRAQIAASRVATLVPLPTMPFPAVPLPTMPFPTMPIPAMPLPAWPAASATQSQDRPQ
jgi:hypothetical protein